MCFVLRLVVGVLSFLCVSVRMHCVVVAVLFSCVLLCVCVSVSLMLLFFDVCCYARFFASVVAFAFAFVLFCL